MYKFLISFFRRRKKESNIQNEENRQDEERNNVSAPDFIDYDGMGNFGRFPPIEKKKNK